MPFAAQTMMEDDEKKKQQQGGGGVNVSGASTTFATNVPGQEATGDAGGSKQKSSGQYANIQSYLDANKSQADGMGQKIAGNVSQKADDATQKIQTFETTAPKVDAYDPNEAIKNATILDDNAKNQYKTMKQTGGYTGPQSLEQAQGYQETAKAAQTAHQDVKNAGSETGQQQLLKQTYNRPQYTAGENRLDQVLLQNSAGSKSALEGLSQKYAGLDQMFSGAVDKVGGAINQANTQALQNKQAFTPAEAAARKALIDPIQARAAEANAGNSGLIDRITADAADETLSEETLALLGLSEGANIYDINLANYLTPDKSQVGLNNAATAEERQKYAALAGLFDDPTMGEITADGKQITPIKFNKEQFEKDLAGKSAEYKNAYETSRGTALDPKFLEPGARYGDSLGAVGAGLPRMDQSTPKELVELWLPRLNQSIAEFGWGQSWKNAIEQSLAQWNDTFKSGRKIKKG